MPHSAGVCLHLPRTPALRRTFFIRFVEFIEFERFSNFLAPFFFHQTLRQPNATTYFITSFARLAALQTPCATVLSCAVRLCALLSLTVSELWRTYPTSHLFAPNCRPLSSAQLIPSGTAAGRCPKM